MVFDQLPKQIKSKLPPILWPRLPILGGPLRGFWWAPGARGKVLRFLTGRYEPEQMEFCADHIQPGHVVFDVGANLGYLTLLFSKLVGQSGRVLAFEPAADVACCLETHVRCNKRSNVSIHPVALGDRQGVVRFENAGGTGTGRLADDGGVEVELTTIDNIVRDQGVLPNFIKIDVEGAGAEVLRGATQTIGRSRPVVYLSLHSAHERDRSMELLSSFGYTSRHDGDGELIFMPQAQTAARSA